MKSVATFLFAGLIAAIAACSRSTSTQEPVPVVDGQVGVPATAPGTAAGTSSRDPRVGLKAGMTDAGEAVSNVRVTAKVPSPEGFRGITNSDIAFTGPYAVQGN